MNLREKLLYYWFWRKKQMKKKKNRSIWVRPIFSKSERNIYGQKLLEDMRSNAINNHMNFFRMNTDTFDVLLRLLTPMISKSDHGREPISARTRLSVTLRYLATGNSMTSLSYLFRIGVSTVSMIISETSEEIWKVLKPIYLNPPTTEDWKKICHGFNTRWQFPNCIGAIDGKHIVIRVDYSTFFGYIPSDTFRFQAPPLSGSSYYNYKGNYSIVLLAVCDYEYKFVLVDIGASGRQSDGGIFACSEIGKKISLERLNIPANKIIGEGRPPMPHVFVGDEAFPLLPNLLKPYSYCTALRVDELVFNYRLSRARLVVENSFGILASRWRIFQRPISAKLENVENIVKASVYLHNLLMTHKNFDYFNGKSGDHKVIPGIWETNTCLKDLGRIGKNNYTKNTKFVCDTFRDFFNEEGSVPWQWLHI